MLNLGKKRKSASIVQFFRTGLCTKLYMAHKLLHRKTLYTVKRKEKSTKRLSAFSEHRVGQNSTNAKTRNYEYRSAELNMGFQDLGKVTS